MLELENHKVRENDQKYILIYREKPITEIVSSAIGILIHSKYEVNSDSSDRIYASDARK